MSNLVQFVIDYWVIIVSLISVIFLFSFTAFKFLKNPSNVQINKVREWLIYACILAEKEIGSGTGQIKLRYVYDLFNQRFKWISRVISFEMFSVLVDEALIVVRQELESNIKVKEYIKKGNEE